MQLDASKDWGEGGGGGIFVSYHLAVEHVTAFLHVTSCFSV